MMKAMLFSVTIGFNATAYAVTEGGSASVSVSVLSGTLAREVVVTLQTLDGTATAPADYTTVSSDLTFNAGTPTLTVEIPTTGDMVLEMSESFSVSLSQMPADTAVTLNPPSTTVTIEDATSVQIGLENPSYTVAEDAGSVRVCATESGPVQLDRDVVVTFTTADDTASAPSDYTALTMDRTFMSGVTEACVDITIVPDNVDEMTADTFSVTLSSTDSAVMLSQDVSTVTIVDCPVITTQPVAQMNVVPGMSAMFSVVATGSDLTYQWQRAGANLTNSANYSGTTTADLTVLNVMEADEEMFRCIITNAVDSVTSMSAQLTVLDPPQISLQPSNQSEVVPGSTVMFMIMATTAAGTLSYQWQRNGVDIPAAAGVSGINSATLTITNVQEVNEGSYSCVVTNDAGSTTSNTAQLTVSVTIGFNATAYTVTEGSSVSVSVSVLSGTLARDVVVTVQTGDDTATAPADYTTVSSALTFNAGTLTQTVEISTTGDMVLEMSESFNVSLSQMPVDSAVTLDPASATVSIQDATSVQIGLENPSHTVAEDAGSVMVCATESGPVQLARDVVVTFTTEDDTATAPSDYTALTMDQTFMSGVTEACVDITIVPDNVDEMTAETFSVTLSSSDSAVMLSRNVSTVSIVDRPVITTQPVAQMNVVPGTNAMFSVVANGSDLTYQWQRAGANLTDNAKYNGATTASLTVLNVMEADEAMFRCIITNAVDSVTSMSAQLTVLDPPQISLQPSDQSEVVPGSTVTFVITATTAAGTLSYQWQRNGVDIPTAAGVSGINSTTLTITNVQEVNEGSYSCVVTNDAGSTTSTTAQLTVLDPPVIIAQPQNRRNVIPDTAVTFSVTVTGLNLAYSWEQGNGSTLPSDSRFVPSNEMMLTIQDVMLSDIGSYRCVVSNDAGNVTSLAAELTLIGPPDITAPPQSVAVESGGNAEFTCTATGLGQLEFMWTTTASVSLPPPVDFSDPEGMNATSTLSLTGVDTSYRGEYTCRVSNERGNDTSQATLSVIVIDDIMPNNDTAPLGSDVMFNCSASGSEDISYRWTRTTVGSSGTLVNVGFSDEFPGRVVGARTSMLTILNVSVVDVEEGYDYTCFVDINSTRVGFRTAILRTQTVTIIEAPSSFNISEGDDLILRCVAQNNPGAPGDLQFFWYNDSIGLEDGGRVSIMTSGENASRVASSELTVMDVEDEDSGNYTCRVTNRDFVDAIAVDSEITVLFSPVLNFPEGQQTMDRVLRIDVGGTLLLMCTATAVPSATYVRILRNDVQLEETVGSDSRSLSVMDELTNLMLSDSDVYVCVATNSEGRTERSFTLRVQDRPGEVVISTVVPTLVSLSSVRLTWTQPEENNANITSYNITYCPTANNGECVAQAPTTISVTANGSSAVLTELTPVRRYRVYIRARNLAGLGPESQPYFFDSADEDDAQTENLRAAFVSDTGVVLTWQLPEIASSEQNVVFSLSYTRRESGVAMTITVTTRRATVGGLVSGGLYDFSVAAMYNLLNSTAASISQETQLVYDPPPNPMVPTVESNSITISWPAPGGVELVVNSTVRYTATNRAGQSSGRKKRQANTISGRIPVPGSATSATVMGDDLQPFYDYVFQVFSNFGNGLVVQVVDDFTATSAQTPPSVPQNLQVGIFHVSLTVSWTAPASPRGIIATYVVCISNLCQTVPADDNEYTRDSLTPGTTYNVRVNAFNGAGPGDVAATTSTTSFGVFPPMISQTLPSPEQGVFNLTIRLPATYGPISHYKVVVVRTGSREINTRTEVPDNMLLPATQSQTNYYAAAALLRVGESQAPFLVGDGQISILNGMTFENVRLSSDQSYVFFTRAYSSQIPTSFNDSEVSQVFITPESTTAPPDSTTTPPESTTAPPDSSSVGAIAGAVAGAAVGSVAIISVSVVIIVVVVTRSRQAQFDLRKEDRQGAGVVSGGASEIKSIPMAECMAYGTLGTHQAKGRGDVSVSQCLAYGVFEGQEMREGEDGAYETVDGIYEPIPN